MRVVVTGAAGRLGRAVVGLLAGRGIDLLAVDREPVHSPGVQALRADLCDLGQAYGALAGAGAVVHLAAIPAPVGRPPEEVYRTNILSTFNVFEAAANLGIRRVVYASSVSALGFPWQHRWSEPLYLPIDETHPLLPQDAYGLSKAQGEGIAEAYCRREAGSAASLRFSTVLTEGAYDPLLAGVRRDPGTSAQLLWSYVDLRDAAWACHLALEASFDGHVPLFITATDTTSELPSDTLLDRYYPGVPRRRPLWDAPPLAEHWSLLDGTRAREVIGYRPEYTWRQVLAEQSDRADGPP